jgi:V8-like Glu-specific endopeptidase
LKVNLIVLALIFFSASSVNAKADAQFIETAADSLSLVLSQGLPGTPHPQIKVANIFGQVDRVRYNDNDPIHKSIINKVGILERPNGQYCTATLVWKNLILTAAHCVNNKAKDGVMKGDYLFCIGLRRGRCRASSTIAGFSPATFNIDKDGRSFDFAILRLQKPLGKDFGFMGTKYLEKLEGVQVSIAGFGYLFERGRRITIQNACHIRSFFREGLAYHDCDTSRSDSGAPIFICDDKDCRIVGLNVSERRNGGKESLTKVNFSEEYGNLFVLSEWFEPFIEDHRKRNP